MNETTEMATLILLPPSPQLTNYSSNSRITTQEGPEGVVFFKNICKFSGKLYTPIFSFFFFTTKLYMSC